MQLQGFIPLIGGWDTGVGRSSSNEPNCWILIENPWPAKKARKMIYLDKCNFFLVIIFEWMRISHKQSSRWQHQSQLKSCAFFYLQ